MTTRATTLAGYAVVAAALLVLHLCAGRLRARGHTPRPSTFGELVTTLTRWPVTRWSLLAGWLWLGWHLFARVEWR